MFHIEWVLDHAAQHVKAREANSGSVASVPSVTCQRQHLSCRSRENMTLKTKNKHKMVILVWACRHVAVAGALSWVLGPLVCRCWHLKLIPILESITSLQWSLRAGISECEEWGVNCPVAILNYAWIVQGPLPNLICCRDSRNGRILSVQRWAWCRLEK